MNIKTLNIKRTLKLLCEIRLDDTYKFTQIILNVRHLT